MNKQPLILIGAGGHCRSCIEVIESCGNFDIKGVLDMTQEGEICGYPVIGTDERIAELAAGHQFLITVGQVATAQTRKRIAEQVKLAKGTLATVIAGSAIVSSRAIIGEGTIVMHQAFVNAGVRIGYNNIINTKALVEHDSVIGNYNHVSTNATLNGSCRIGNENFIGSNSVLVHGVAIGDDVVIGAGSVVIRDIMQAGKYAGNPAKKI